MSHYKQCPIPNKGGKDCWQEPHPANSFGICIEHWRKVVEQWHDEDPSVSVTCMHCGGSSHFDPVDLKTAICHICHQQISDPGILSQLLEMEATLRQPGSKVDVHGVVYYMRFSDRVKIGFTTNLSTRALQVPNDEVIAAEPGTYALERQRHEEFTVERMTERGEWFTMSPRLAFHMANIRDAHGDPFAVSARRRLSASRR